MSRKESSEWLKAEGEVSLFTTATWTPSGSPPIHKQMRDTWMTGSRNWKHSELWGDRQDAGYEVTR